MSAILIYLLAVLVDRGFAMKLIIICLLLTVSELRKKRLFVLDSPSLSELVFAMLL